MEKRVGIVMPCINLWSKYTSPAIASVFLAAAEAEKRGIDVGFILIDNGSTDETQAEAQKTLAGVRGFEYHRNDEMWSFPRSVNFGVKHFLGKGFDLVLVLNNDIVLHQNAIVNLARRFESKLKPAVAMATCLDATGECLRDPKQLARIDDAEKERNCPETPHPCFSAFMLSRECWEAIGEFDEVFAPAYYEDNDYHYRMQLAGLLAITYPPALFFHWGSATQNEALGHRMTETANQHAQYVRKWGGDPTREQFKRPYNDDSKDIKSVKQTA